jgi:hypothetical protein
MAHLHYFQFHITVPHHFIVSTRISLVERFKDDFILFYKFAIIKDIN